MLPTEPPRTGKWQSSQAYPEVLHALHEGCTVDGIWVVKVVLCSTPAVFRLVHKGSGPAENVQEGRLYSACSQLLRPARGSRDAWGGLVPEAFADSSGVNPR